MIGRRLVWWRAKRQPDSLLLYNKRLLLLIILLNGLLQTAKALTGIEFNVDPNNIAAVNSQLKRKNTELKEYSAIINEEANLPCNISAPSIEDSVALILWYRAGGKNAIYTVDARNTPSLKEAKHFISPALKNRVQLVCDNGENPLLDSPALNKFTKEYKVRLNRTKRSTKPSSAPTATKLPIKSKKSMKTPVSGIIRPQTEKRCILRIKPVQQEDGMVDYRCRVDFKRGRTINFSMYLNLIVPSTKLEIFASNSETGLSERVSDTSDVVSKEIGPFVEDELLNLTCVSAGGNPPPRVEWWANDQLIDDSYERTVVSQVNRVVNLLKVGPLDRSYQGRAYTCKVTNSDLSSPVEQTVNLKVDLKPRDLRIESKPTVIRAKERVVLTCKCANGRPPSQLQWFREEQLIENENLIQTELNSETDELVSRLAWPAAPEDNEKRIKCRLVNRRFPNLTMEDSLTLNIQFAPSVSLVFGSSRGNEELLEDSDVIFECNVQSNPTVSAVQWLFNGRPLIEDPTKKATASSIPDSRQRQSSDRQSLSRPVESNSTGQSNLSNNLSNKMHYNNLETAIQSLQSAVPSTRQTGDEFAKSLTKSLTKSPFPTDWSQKPFDDSLEPIEFGSNRTRQKRRTAQNESAIQLPNISISARSLLLKGASFVHSGSYQCSADNSIGVGHSDVIPLHVHFAPRCADNQLQYVLKNSETASISCEIDADPAAVNFHWLLLSGSGELTSEAALTNAYEHYQTKQSTVAPFTSFYHHIQDHFQGGHASPGLAASPAGKDHALNLSSPNIQFSIEYTSMNGRNASGLLWQSGQPQTSSSPANPIRVRSIATFKPTQNSHYGALQCWASNEVGVQKHPCTFFVLAAQAPDPPVNCTTTNITISGLTVECTPGYSGGLPQTTYHLEVYTKQAELPAFKQQINLASEKRKGSANEILLEESTNVSSPTVSPTPLPTKVLIDGKSMLLLHNLSAEYPFFSVNTLPPGNSFYLITYAKNIRGTSKKIEITANTLTAERWQTADVLVDYLERNVITTPILISIIVTCCLCIFLLTTILVLRLRSLKSKPNTCTPTENKSSRENLPFELCLPLDTSTTDLQIHAKYPNTEPCLKTLHHRMLQQYSTLQHSANHPNHLASLKAHQQSASSHRLNHCVCDSDACKNCNQLPLPHSYLDSASGEITLESFDGSATLNRRTIPISILLPPNHPSNQAAQMGAQSGLMPIGSPLTLTEHLSAFAANQQQTICNSIDQSSNTSVDQTTTTNSLEQNSTANRVFFIRASNEPDFIHPSNSLRSAQLRNKVQITGSGYNNGLLAGDKINEQETSPMLYLTSESTADQSYDYYKLLNRTPMFDDPYQPDSTYLGGYNGLELLASPYLHEQVANLNNNDQPKTHLDPNFEKELSLGSASVELMDGSSIEANQSLNNKTLSSQVSDTPPSVARMAAAF